MFMRNIPQEKIDFVVAHMNDMPRIQILRVVGISMFQFHKGSINIGHVSRNLSHKDMDLTTFKRNFTLIRYQQPKNTSDEKYINWLESLSI